MNLLRLMLLSLAATVCCLPTQPIVSFEHQAGSLQIAAPGKTPTIVVHSHDYPGVLLAARNLANDLGRVTGSNATLVQTNATSLPGSSSGNGSPLIVVASLNKSPLSSALKQAAGFKPPTGPETLTTFLAKDALYLTGTDKRGTIYAAYTFTKQIGVSPLHYWADVPAKSHRTIYALNTTVTSTPQVRHRGIFINDEQPALTNWVNVNFPPGKYGPGFNADYYELVFDLILRMGGNYIWPASWNSMLSVDDPRSAELADRMGIEMGTSHTEPMMRWTKEQTLFLKGDWSWQSNRDRVTAFMREGVRRGAPYEGVWTMGMRGLGDNISPTLNPAQLEEIIRVQQSMLREQFGTLQGVHQSWCLYNEVGGYYSQGMTVPEDITLVWADDFWGNLPRLPLGNETHRSGGAGVYYHFDFVGPPRDYKWINTVQLERTWEQMRLAWARHARTLWIVNVGDLKGLEIPTAHWFDLAWGWPGWDQPSSTSTWLRQWAASEFGSEWSADMASAIGTYGRLAARRKYESLDPATYSVTAYREAELVLEEWHNLSVLADAIHNRLPRRLQPAFFEMVLHPVLAGYNLHQLYLTAGRQHAYAYQWRTSTNRLAQQVLAFSAQDANLTRRFHDLLGGKWNHMMDQTHMGYNWWQQPMRNVLPPLYHVQPDHVSLAGILGVTAEGSNGSAPGDSVSNNGNAAQTMPQLDRYHAAGSRYLDVYLMGPGRVEYAVTASGAPWVNIAPASGTLSSSSASADESDEARVYFSVDWTKAPPGSSSVDISIAVRGQNTSARAVLPVLNARAPASFAGFVESDRAVSLEAPHFSKTLVRADAFEIVPNYGRFESGGVTLDSRRPPPPGGGARLVYPVYTFTSTRAALVVVYAGPSLNSDPLRPLRYAVGIDDGPALQVQPVPAYAAGTRPAAWNAAVLDNVWVNVTRVGELRAGRHELKVWLLEPGLVLEKIVLDLGGVRKSYLGPPESVRV